MGLAPSADREAEIDEVDEGNAAGIPSLTGFHQSLRLEIERRAGRDDHFTGRVEQGQGDDFSGADQFAQGRFEPFL